MKASRRVFPVIAMAALLVACGGGGGGGGGGNANGDLATSVDLAAGDEAAPVALLGGRYRLTITENCDSWGVRITGPDGSAIFDRTDAPSKVFFLHDLADGPYVIEQTVEDCDDWSVRLARVSG